MDTEIIHLENRMSQIESKLDVILTLMHKIEQGVFGDEKIGHKGTIETQIALQKQIDALREEIQDLKRVNHEQDTAIRAKKGLTDDVTKWMQRGFWGLLCVIAFVLLVTGKIGISDLLKLK